MKHTISLITLAAILICGCSKKNTGPEEKPPPESPGAPVIENVSRLGGWVGQEVLIGGENFGDKQDSSRVTFGDSLAVIDHWSETVIDTEIPRGAKSGDIVVTVNGMQSNSIPFKVYGIDRVVPQAGYPGTEVRLYGSGFTNNQGSSTVRFGNRNATISLWSDTLIVVIVPTGASTGNIVLSTRQHQSEWSVFVVPDSLEITSIEPQWGPWGTEVTVTGFGFGEEQGWSVVTFNGTEALIVSWSDSIIVAEVPDNSTSGDVIVAAGGSIETNGIYFNVFRISEVIPASLGIEETCEIIGEGFGDTQGDGAVIVGDIDLEILSWSDMLIQVAIPHGASSGAVRVKVNGVTSNSVDLTVYLVPSISNIDPEWGPWGASVTISGSQFGNAQGTNSVRFNGIDAAVSSWSYESIVTEIPHGCASGDLIVQVGDVESNPTSFSVFGILEVSPSLAISGDTITITGTGFGQSQNGGYVIVYDVLAPIISWSDDVIVAEVPDGTQTGEVRVSVNNIESNGVGLAILIPPHVNAITPDFGTYGTEVVITGSDFTSSSDSGIVKFSGMVAPILSWADQMIVAELPHGSRSGDMEVEVLGFGSNRLPFSVFGITYITPAWVGIGDAVTILGNGFGESQGSNYATVGDVVLPVVSWSDSALQIEIPEGTSSGDLAVLIDGFRSNTVAITVGSSASLVGLLQQTDHVEVTFSGVITFCDKRFQTFRTKVNLNLWDLNSFSGIQAFGNWRDETVREVHGTMASDCSKVDSAFSSFENHYMEPMFDVHEDTEIKLTLHDIPLTAIVSQDSISLTYELSGPSVQDHLSNIYMYYYYYSGPWDWHPESEWRCSYGGTDWDNVEHPPKLTVTFKKL